MATAEHLVSRREGSRWIGARPSGSEIAAWFAENVRVHDGMSAGEYVSGVTLITALETVSRPALSSSGDVIILKQEQVVHVPYVRVDTRVAYFWSLMALHPDWLGVIEPVRLERLKAQGYHNAHLPPGFFHMPVARPDGKWAHFVGCSMQVRVLRRATVRDVHGRLDGEPVMLPAPGTKIVNVNGRSYEDPHSLMKAETGAVGRALGMAGMLVLGSGVASYEDMLELGDRGGGAPDDVAVPQPAGEDLRARAIVLLGQLETDFPGAHEEIQEWARARKLNLDDLGPQQLRGVTRQLEKKLAEARHAG